MRSNDNEVDNSAFEKECVQIENEKPYTEGQNKEDFTVELIQYKKRTSSKSSDKFIHVLSDEGEEQKDNSEETIVNFQTPQKPLIVRRQNSLSISYEYLVWIVFAFLTLIAMIDRFAMNGDVFLGRERKY